MPLIHNNLQKYPITHTHNPNPPVKHSLNYPTTLQGLLFIRVVAPQILKLKQALKLTVVLSQVPQFHIRPLADRDRGLDKNTAEYAPDKIE